MNNRDADLVVRLTSILSSLSQKHCDEYMIMASESGESAKRLEYYSKCNASARLAKEFIEIAESIAMEAKQ
jgi:hypothetical protein